MTKEAREVRIVKCGDNDETFAVEVFFNYETTEKSYIDDELLKYFFNSRRSRRVYFPIEGKI